MSPTRLLAVMPEVFLQILRDPHTRYIVLPVGLSEDHLRPVLAGRNRGAGLENRLRGLGFDRVRAAPGEVTLKDGFLALASG